MELCTDKYISTSRILKLLIVLCYKNLSTKIYLRQGSDKLSLDGQESQISNGQSSKKRPSCMGQFLLFLFRNKKSE